MNHSVVQFPLLALGRRLPRVRSAQQFRARGLMAALFVGLLVGGCGGGSGGGAGGAQSAAGATSQICPNVTGTEAIAWDVYNGVPRADTSVLPPAVPAGPIYGHPTNLQLSFFHPPGWTPTDFASNTNVGVVLVRDDQQALWKHEDVFVPGQVSVGAARDEQITRIKQFVGQAGAQITTVCLNEGSSPIGSQFSNIMFRVGNHTAIVTTRIIFVPGTLTTAVNYKAMVAPTAEFPARAIDTFLAIDWQMLVCSGPAHDRDNDGDPDLTDPAPCDPFINTANPFRPI